MRVAWLIRQRAALSVLMVVAGLLLMLASAWRFQTWEAEPPDWSRYGYTEADISAQIAQGVHRNVFVFRELRQHVPVAQASGLLLLGVGLLGLGWLARPPEGWPRPGPARLHPAWLDWPMLLVGILLLWIAGEATAQASPVTVLHDLSHHLQVLFLLGGAFSVAAGLGGLVSAPPDYLRPRWPGREARLVLALTGLALVLRLWNLQDGLRVLVDELPFITASRAFGMQPDVEILAPLNEVFPFTKLFSYSIWWSGEILGRSYAAARVPSAVIGALYVPALYLLARAWFDPWTARLAALLALTFPPLLHFNRLALLHNFDAFFGLVALAALGWALRSGRRVDYAFAGLALGLTQYFYEGGRLFFLPMVAAWLLGGWLLWRPRYDPRGALVALGTAILVAAPHYYGLLGLRAESTGRLTRTRLPDSYWEQVLTPTPNPDALQAFLDRLQQPFLHLVSIPDSSLFYAGESALLLVPVAACVMAGAGLALWRWRHPAGGLLLLWCLGPPLSMVLLVDSGQSIRLSVALPGLILLAALGLRYGVGHGLRRLPRAWAWAVLAVLGIGLSFAQGYYYFQQHLPGYNTEFRETKLYPDVEDGLLHVAAHYPRQTQVVIVSQQDIASHYASEVLQYLWDNPEVGVQIMQPDQLTPDYLDLRLLNVPYIFLVAPDDLASRQTLLIHTRAEPRGGTPYAAVVPTSRRLELYYIPPLTLDDVVIVPD